MKEKERLIDKIKLNVYMSIYNSEEVINLIKEYQSKFGCDGDINTDMMHKFMMIREIQKETFDELNKGGKENES